MRSPSTFSEARLNFSFFLTTPAKKPRTECCCQSVAFMMAAIVVPFGCRSIASTASCFEDEGLLEATEEVWADGFERLAFAEHATLAAHLLRGVFAARFVDFGFVL